jgi:transposase
MPLAVVKLSEANKGFGWLPKRWVVERSHAWAARLRRLARDDARVATTRAGLHFVAFAILMLKRCVALLLQHA